MSGSIISQTKTGDVWIRDFDLGVITTMGGVLGNWSYDGEGQQNYFIPFTGMATADLPLDQDGNRAPGVPVIFRAPKAPVSWLVVPSVEVLRDDPTNAPNRRASAGYEYKASADGAAAKTVTRRDGTEVTGYDKYETKVYAHPYDFNYTITMNAKDRTQAQLMLKQLLKVWKPQSRVLVKDSLGETRSYDAMQEGLSDISDALSVNDRVMGWSITLRVEGELDLNDPVVHNAVWKQPTIQSQQKE